QAAENEGEQKAIAAAAAGSRSAIADETIARLADDYEAGALLGFYFAEQLRDFQASGVDAGNFLIGMITRLTPEEESKRLAKNSGSRERALAAPKSHPPYSIWLIDPLSETRDASEVSRSSALMKNLSEIEKLLQIRNYEEAESRLKSLLQEF